MALALTVLAATWASSFAAPNASRDASAPSPAAPNILVIIADDLGIRDLVCYGSMFYETPNIDQLAADGVRFTRAYSAGSVCSPTRASIQSGKFPARIGITDWIPGQKPPKDAVLNSPSFRQKYPPAETSIGSALRDAGYQTFYAGKWHLGDDASAPDQIGYEIYFSDADLGRIKGNNSDTPEVGRRISEEASRFISGQGKRDAARPFFMFLSYHEPHTPILEYPDHIARFRAKPDALAPSAKPASVSEHGSVTRARQDNPVYASELAGLDTYVGQVMSALKTAGLSENTIVIFLSDNGGLATGKNPGPTSNAPLRSGKGWLYEGGTRIPLIVRAPGIAKPGTITPALFITNDLYPTLLSLARAPLRPAQHVDGIDLSAALAAPAELPASIVARDTLYWHYPHYHGTTWAPGASILSGQWKLIHFYETGADELYDLASDPVENKNLAAQNPDRVAALRSQLETWQRSVGAKLPVKP